MVDNINENGLAPNDIDMGEYRVDNPALLDSEYRVGSSLPTVKNPALLDSEYQGLASMPKVSSAGVVVGDDAGRNLVMFV